MYENALNDCAAVINSNGIRFF